MLRNLSDYNPNPGYQTIDLYQQFFRPKEKGRGKFTHYVRIEEFRNFMKQQIISQHAEIFSESKVRIRHFHLLRNPFSCLNHRVDVVHAESHKRQVKLFS